MIARNDGSILNIKETAAVAQWYNVRFECGWSGFDPQSRQTQVVNVGCESSTAKRSTTGACFTDPRRWPLTIVSVPH